MTALRFRCFFGRLRSWLIALAGVCVFSGAHAENDSPKVKFDPEVETKLAELMGKYKDARKKVWQSRFEREISAVRDELKITDDQSATLKAVAGKAIDDCIGGWAEKVEDSYRTSRGYTTENLLTIIKQGEAMVQNYATSEYLTGYTQPRDHELWTAGLRQILTPEQFEKWQKLRDEREDKLKKQIREFLKPSGARMSEQYAEIFRNKASELKFELENIPKERVEKLEDLGKSISDKYADGWKERAEKLMLVMDDSQRTGVMKSGQFYLGQEEDSYATMLEDWKKGMTAILGAEDVSKLNQAETERKTRRIGVFGGLMVAELDRHVAFTLGQREKLVPFAEKVVVDEQELFPKVEMGNSYFSASTMGFYRAAARIAETDVKALLDDVQLKRWRTIISDPAKQAQSRNRRQVSVANAGSSSVSVARQEEPEDVENAVSDFLMEILNQTRDEIQTAAIIRAEDVIRVTKVDDARAVRLLTAAKGSAEQALSNWRLGIEDTIRSMMTDVTAQNIRQRLGSIQPYQYRQNRNTTESSAYWDRTIGNDLTLAEQNAWKVEVEARDAFRDSAAAAVIICEFDRRHLLTEDQRKKLEPRVKATLKEYQPEILQYFSYYDGNPWYMQSQCMFIPIAAIPEEELKGLIGKEKWDHWVKSDQFGNVESYWQSIRENHEQRLKREKKK